MNKTVLTTAGSLLSAFLASLCCVGPVMFSIAGAGSLGFATIFEPYRPYLMLATVTFLGAGFYVTYQKREITCEDGTCKQESGRTLSKILLWIAAVVSLVFLFFPQILGSL